MKYHAVDDSWNYQSTVVYIEDELVLSADKKGTLRDVIKIQFMHQEENKGK